MSDEPDQAMLQCDRCGGEFPPEDMDGAHCRQCASELSGDGEQ